MAKDIDTVLRLVRGHLRSRTRYRAIPDGPLLERFIHDGDSNAFSALTERHGSMVLGVCRRVLRDPHDVEDVFQATFLTLYRKAEGILRRDSLASWLHRVAFRLSLNARASAARRRLHEREAAARVRPHVTPLPGELGPMLDEELNRLRESYRTVLILCYLQGMTHEQAAEALRWPVGTVRGRLARARDLLRRRLNLSLLDQFTFFGKDAATG